MRLSAFVITALLVAKSTVIAYKGSVIKRPKQSPSSLDRRSPQTDSQINVDGPNDEDNKVDLSSVHDVLYMANITVGGVDYEVQLDTGSSDMFIKGSTTPIPGAEDSNLMYNLTYAIGWAYGHISFAPVEFVGLPIASQAFVDTVLADNPVLGNGGDGILGLGFNRMSHIDYELKRAKSSEGRSLLYNIFDANPNEGNFLAFAFQRELEDEGDVDGSFAIGEIEMEYSAVLGNERIPTYPVQNPQRWNILLDALILNDTIIGGTTQVSGAPSNKAVALIDTGSSWTYVPREVSDAIYSQIPGAYFAEKDWEVPCDAEINMALQFGGQIFPVHPLDVVMYRNSKRTSCRGSFIPADNLVTDLGIDWLVGDNFLRSVYTLYDFGDFDVNMKMGDPYMKMLALFEPDEMSISFHNLRGGEPRTGIKFVGLDGVELAPSFSISTDISKSLEMLGKWLPLVFGIVGANALILLIAGIVWLVSFIRKRRRRAIARTPRARGGTRPGTAMSGRPNSYIAGMDAGMFSPPGMSHTYEPVSMALTEDTFVPPSPAFHSEYKGERPKSVA